jgi:hypothetical protein
MYGSRRKGGVNFLKLRYKSLWIRATAAALVALPLLGVILKIKLGFHDGEL